MIKLFQYNWTVRNEWFELLKQVPSEELLLNRTGGLGGILKTIFHILDVEYSWIRGIQGKPDIQVPFENFQTLLQVKELSDSWLEEILAVQGSARREGVLEREKPPLHGKVLCGWLN
ncbi:DinB family protein [Paenibacillus harenae]|uniref:DinB family protein n=1 Tax=Paenibacillus harenae TaxID=306543 RepID=UPI0027912FA5|nr:DinB family protein [Paenibacillus harenae]MDQ0057880.1 putative damage-inducible protein DinB [Paenibacillus harenae]